ncbi:MAG: hypothetical protein RLZZ210_28, partial [Pseudomonadota bacterium]
CHLKYYNHSKNFYTFLKRFIPEYKNIKQKLELFLS